MNTVFWITYACLSLATFMAWSYVQGRSTERWRNDQTCTSNPPYFLLALTAMFWPVQLVGVLCWLLFRFSYGRGTGRGMAINEELTIARKTARELHEEQRRIMTEILTKGLDPNDELGLRALTESTVRHSMEVERLKAKKRTRDQSWEDKMRSVGFSELVIDAVQRGDEIAKVDRQNNERLSAAMDTMREARNILDLS